MTVTTFVVEIKVTVGETTVVVVACVEATVVTVVVDTVKVNVAVGE
jgi:hypothetical protein